MPHWRNAEPHHQEGMNMVYIVTGAAGFIGSNIVKALNARGIDDIVAVDNLRNAAKFKNLVDCRIAGYLDKTELLATLRSGHYEGKIAAIFHQGACSNTMEIDGRYMMENNYQYSVALLDYCQTRQIRLFYASSASVYGNNTIFKEAPEYESPLNVYGYSKLLFDQHVRRMAATSTAQVVGLRYFNVYGPREQHKERMASVALHFFRQFTSRGKIQLFGGSGGYPDGEQRRDFVAVDDVVKVNLWFLDHPQVSGIFNLGTGRSQTFNEMGVAVVNAAGRLSDTSPCTLDELRARQVITYCAMPAELNGKYQSFTEADLSDLRGCGYDGTFMTVEQGVEKYLDVLRYLSE